MTKQEIIDYMYENHVQGDFKIEEMAEDLAQPRKGKWIRHFDGNEWYWYCSSCKEQWYEEDLWMGGNSFPNFCPNCGADMRPQFEEGEKELTGGR